VEMWIDVLACSAVVLFRTIYGLSLYSYENRYGFIQQMTALKNTEEQYKKEISFTCSRLCSS